MYIVAVVAEKGGVGKTTVALALAVAATRDGKRAAVIDTDPQATASKWTDRRDAEFPWVVPTHAARLRAAIEQAKGQGIEFLVIDTPPHAGMDAAEAARVRDEEAAQARLAVDQEADAQRREAEKKKIKLPASNSERPIDDFPTYEPSHFATNKLINFEYVELWYFSKEGCRDAFDSQHSIAAEGFGLTRADEGLARAARSHHDETRRSGDGGHALQASRRAAPRRGIRPPIARSRRPLRNSAQR